VAGWWLVGLRGVHAETWARTFPPLLWPLSLTTPEEALAEFKAHRLGQIWLGTLRQAGRAHGTKFACWPTSTACGTWPSSWRTRAANCWS